MGTGKTDKHLVQEVLDELFLQRTRGEETMQVGAKKLL